MEKRSKEPKDADDGLESEEKEKKSVTELTGSSDPDTKKAQRLPTYVALVHTEEPYQLACGAFVKSLPIHNDVQVITSSERVYEKRKELRQVLFPPGRLCYPYQKIYVIGSYLWKQIMATRSDDYTHIQFFIYCSRANVKKKYTTLVNVHFVYSEDVPIRDFISECLSETACTRLANERMEAFSYAFQMIQYRHQQTHLFETETFFSGVDSFRGKEAYCQEVYMDYFASKIAHEEVMAKGQIIANEHFKLAFDRVRFRSMVNKMHDRFAIAYTSSPDLHEVTHYALREKYPEADYTVTYHKYLENGVVTQDWFMLNKEGKYVKTYTSLRKFPQHSISYGAILKNEDSIIYTYYKWMKVAFLILVFGFCMHAIGSRNCLLENKCQNI